MLKRMISVTILFLLPVMLHAVEPHGFVKTSLSLGVRGDNQYKFINNNVRVQINLEKELGDSGSVYVNFDLLYEKYMDEEPRLELVPVEFYAQYYGNWWGVKAGKYYEFWGLFDWISPTDIINPWDMTHISSDIEDYRISVYGINFSAGNDTINLDVNLLPIFQPDILPGFNTEDVELPSQRLSNVEIAARLSGSVETAGLDWDVYGFKGFQRTPSMKFTSLPNPTTTPILPGEIYYQKIAMVGADTSYAISSILLKFEGAYFQTEDTEGENPFADNPFFSVIAGFDWSVMPELAISAAYKFKRYTVYDPQKDPNTDRNNGTISLSVKYQPKDYFNLQWITLYVENDNSLFFLPYFSYSIIDDYSVTLGAVLFYGTRDSTFGKLTEFSNMFLEIKGSF